MRAVSNQAGESDSTWSNTARRRSAPIRSPSQVTSTNRAAVASASSTITPAIAAAVAFSLAMLPLANPPSITCRTPWPRASTRPEEASSATAAQATLQR